MARLDFCVHRVLTGDFSWIEEVKKPKKTLGRHAFHRGSQEPIFLNIPRPTSHETFNSISKSSIYADRSSSGQVRASSMTLFRIRNFLQHSSQFGFFLNIHRFQEATNGRSGQRPAPVLLDAVNLWAMHLSASGDFSTYEAGYLSRALGSMVNAMAGTHSSNTVLPIIQAECRRSLVISSELHRIRSTELNAATFRTPPPRASMEEYERISGFWTVVILDNCFTTANGLPSNISHTDPNTRIDSPWPLDINAPGLNNQVLPNSSFGTVSAFLGNQPDSGTSILALHAKASLLFK
ncbi:hypothetical protein C8R45DRAFT_948019 [Mycena sanguinolenta]|nr:hypothetical protein C8R45DRAFT_948019 [Mycena sanguinolenta]